MHRALLAPLLISLASPSFAQSRPDQIDQLRAAAIKDDLAWEIVEGLTTEVGPRLAGTDAEARARDWSAKKLKALGFSNVRIEEYRMPVWERGMETAEVVGPANQKLAVTALGRSASTGENGLTAQVVGFDTLDALRSTPDGSLKGKIAFISHAMHATQDGSSYGYFGPARFSGPAIAASKGAAAVLVRSMGTDRNRLPHTGATTFPPGTTSIPAAALSAPDAEQLQRLLARSKDVRIHLVLTPRLIGERTSGNVVAEVPGSDPGAGIVLIGGHLDSWDLGTGAVDDAAGVAITAAAAKLMLDANRRPRRTIRIIWWGSEEVGGFGSRDYFDRHKGENVVLVAESDFGADRVWRLQTGLAPTDAALTEALAAGSAPLGIAYDKGTPDGGADVEAWIEAGVAAVDLDQDGTRYFDLHHSANDTLDKVDIEQLRQNVAAWAVTLSIVADWPKPISRTGSK